MKYTKTHAKRILTLLLLLVFAPVAGAAYPEVLVPMGHTVGVHMNANGVIIVGLSTIQTSAGPMSPAGEAGAQAGDLITSINGSALQSSDTLQNIIQNSQGQHVELEVTRGQEQITLQVKPALAAEDQTFRLGAWVRDQMSGIGTLTFYDPQTGTFGALGHGISDAETEVLMPLAGGSIMHSHIIDIRKGAAGKPGELKGAFAYDDPIGTLTLNTQQGIFGTLNDIHGLSGQGAIPLASRKEVKTGPAVIYSHIEGDKVESFTIEILRIYNQPIEDNRNFMIRVTDARLLAHTGGIVQGMSGSPIIQNGKLVGAVTHVLVGDPRRGYGIFIDNMLEAGLQMANAA